MLCLINRQGYLFQVENVMVVPTPVLGQKNDLFPAWSPQERLIVA